MTALQPSEMIGQRFGLLTVVGQVPGRGKTRWECVCECGKNTVAVGSYLRIGDIKSCGCLQPKRAAESARKHGKRFSAEYYCWAGMKARCQNEKNPGYENYGGRGITVCDRWNDFANFLADMGPRPSLGHSIDRINNDGNYEPGNCRWATMSEQAFNRRPKRRPA